MESPPRRGSDLGTCMVKLGHGEVWVYRGTGVSRGVRRTNWERSLKKLGAPNLLF